VAEDEVLVERIGSVAVVTLNRPKVHNALNAGVLRALGDIVATLDADGAINAVVLTGAGEKSFCAGADLDELVGLDAPGAKQALAVGQGVMVEIARSRVPIISAVNGIALGGGFELVLATTFPVVSERASFGLPESGLGLIPGYGGTQRLPQLIGRAAAAHLMLTGERLSAERAYQLGLTPVPPVAAADVLARAVDLARTIAGRGPRANSAILEALQTAAPRPDQLAFETSLAGIATGGAEAAEGIAAFKERRTPKFAARTES
jgi:enoyl-CoA hydratase